MLNHIRKFFDEFIATESPDARDQDIAVRCAAAALLLEMAHLDDVLEPTEQAAILNAVREGFELSPEQAEELIACANEERTQATDYHQFTSLINGRFDAAQKERLIEALWRVAYADQVLCKHQEHLLRRLANLLHVPHSVFIATKLRVLQ
jgi:uncharacterized tellurite resistance protein B-like protein